MISSMSLIGMDEKHFPRDTNLVSRLVLSVRYVYPVPQFSTIHTSDPPSLVNPALESQLNRWIRVWMTSQYVNHTLKHITNKRNRRSTVGFLCLLITHVLRQRFEWDPCPSCQFFENLCQVFPEDDRCGVSNSLWIQWTENLVDHYLRCIDGEAGQPGPEIWIGETVIISKAKQWKPVDLGWATASWHSCSTCQLPKRKLLCLNHMALLIHFPLMI